MYKKFMRLSASTLMGLLLGVSLSLSPLANATTGAVFDIVRRAYFVATSGYPMTIGTAGTDTFTIIAASTPVALVSSSGISLQSGAQMSAPAAAVITPSTSSFTPAAGYTLTNRNTILAAGAPTLAIVVLPVATTSIGKKYTLYNQGSNPVLLEPQTGVINVSAALTPYSCATLKECECTGLTSAGFACSSR